MSKPRSSAYNLNRAEVVDANFTRFVKELPSSTGKVTADPASVIDPQSGLTGHDLLELFESEMIARHQDLESRNMRARNEGFYTIGSSGHETNAVVGRLTRHTDPAFLHYRSGAFLAERARKVPGLDFVRDVMLSFAASSEDPISGGRHKVWGSVPMHVPPQTSTIASHLPKAVGTAYFLRRATKINSKRVNEETGKWAEQSHLPISSFTHPFIDLPSDSIVICSFGDASINHASAQAAFNTASWTAFQSLQLPILFVCEDNGIGISVPSPRGWVQANMECRPGIKYFQPNGIDIVEAFRVTKAAVDFCRQNRSPAFLRLKVVRLLGHAGTDAEHGYRSREEIETAEALDPLLGTAKIVIDARLMTPAQVLERYESVRARVQECAKYAATTPRLTTAEEIIAPLAPYHLDEVTAETRRFPYADARSNIFGGETNIPERGAPKHMAALINLGLHDLMIKYPEAALFGEDVAKKGGVYNVTNGLESKFGVGRVFNTLLDETSILGMAIGAGHLGMLPIPEIQYLAYYHNAEDQIRGEACSLQYFSNGQFRNPMVIRIQGWSYQKGFGGHFHNDNSIAALRDVPGLVIATPSRGDDAVKIMRTLMALAKVDGRVCVIIEPIALYMTKDLHEPKDGAWQFPYPAPGDAIPLGEGAVYDEDARDLTIFTFANGLYMSLRAAKELRDKHGVDARVVDLRWLNPLNENLILEQARATGKVLVVDESRKTGGVAEAILALIHENCKGEVTVHRLNAIDTYVPLGPAAELVLPVERDIVLGALHILN